MRENNDQKKRRPPPIPLPPSPRPAIKKSLSGKRKSRPHTRIPCRPCSALRKQQWLTHTANSVCPTRKTSPLDLVSFPAHSDPKYHRRVYSLNVGNTFKNANPQKQPSTYRTEMLISSLLRPVYHFLCCQTSDDSRRVYVVIRLYDDQPTLPGIHLKLNAFHWQPNGISRVNSLGMAPTNDNCVLKTEMHLVQYT